MFESQEKATEYVKQEINCTKFIVVSWQSHLEQFYYRSVQITEGKPYDGRTMDTHRQTHRRTKHDLS